MDKLRLIDVTEDNWKQICALSPSEEGRRFVSANAYSIAQSFYEKDWIIKGIEKGNQLIGFTMYGFSRDLAAYELCRFMIDERYQGKGYGSQALQIILDEMFRRYECERIYLTTAPSNMRGKHIYRKAGFIATGDTRGEGDNGEEVFCLWRQMTEHIGEREL